MVEERQINWSKVLLAFLIASFLLGFGLLLGFLGSKVIEGASINVLQSTNTEISGLETLNLLEQNFPCSTSTLDVATTRLAYLSDLIDSMETAKGKTDPQVLDLKQLYSIVEVRHMLLLKQRQNSCYENYSIINYFYSNDNSCKDQTGQVAFILSYLRNKYSSVRVYSFDMGLQSDVVQVLKSHFNASGCYTVVVNDKVIGEVKTDQDVESKL